MMKLLLEKCARLNKEFADDEKEFFFGMYGDSIKDFKLLRGDRHLITEIAAYVQKLFNEKGRESFAAQFEAPKRYKIGKNGTDNFSCGLFFGKNTGFGFLRNVSVMMK